MDLDSRAPIPQNDRVGLWIASTCISCVTLTPLADDDRKLRSAILKRKRAMSLPANVPTSSSQRSESPERRRTGDTDDVQPEQSASQLGNETLLPLGRSNTFSPPTSQVSSSPTRETPIALRSAWPPVLTESLNGLQEAPPDHVERLRDWLAEGVDFGFIPQGLQVRALDSMFPTQFTCVVACHKGRSQSRVPNHQIDRLRPQRQALR